ncbi:hypothetical protein LAZ67_2005883 [Cordylochernes scorpioides]|uniref:Transposase n=1 Tax=Cordylochernes scorpioides TaxID=51811 RepID=A0ABY6K7R0_9ARAC|nr:hypothetical protein LAZ67_2005883 [Cordylochernes scorpioides]
MIITPAVVRQAMILLRSPSPPGRAPDYWDHLQQAIYPTNDKLVASSPVPGNYSPRHTTKLRWYCEFQRGKYGIRDVPRLGSSVSSVNEKNIAAVKKLLETDRHRTYHQIEESLDISAPEIHSILHDHLEVMKLGFIILMCLLKSRTKFGSLKVKAYLCLYENIDALRRKSVRHWEIKKTFTTKWYTEKYLPKVVEAIKKLRPNSRTDTWLFHHDNAPVHRSKACADYLARTELKLLEHPPYSPDLAP